MAKWWMVFFLITGYVATMPAQEFLQIEVQNDPETIKYGLGQKIVIKTKQNDEWQAIALRKFIYETGTILYDQGMLQVDDIVAIRETRPGVGALSVALTTFGGAWLAYGLISQGLDNKAEFGTKEIVIGVAALATGWGVKKAFYKRDFHIGKRYRLRLMDMRMK
jgi:hypothetical protein